MDEGERAVAGMGDYAQMYQMEVERYRARVEKHWERVTTALAREGGHGREGQRGEPVRDSQADDEFAAPKHKHKKPNAASLERAGNILVDTLCMYEGIGVAVCIGRTDD